MKRDRQVPTTVDEYIAAFPPGVQAMLKKIRATVRKAAPAADEAIKYGMPTFVLNGNVVFFAAFKNHVGFYGASTGEGTLKDELSAYAGPKGSLKFAMDEPIPTALIAKSVKCKVRENRARAERKARKAAAR